MAQYMQYPSVLWQTSLLYRKVQYPSVLWQTSLYRKVTLWVFGRRNASQNNFWIFTEQPTNTRRMNLPTCNLQEMFLFLGDDRGAAY